MAAEENLAYRPNDAVLARLHDVTFVGVVGMSGVGKTTLINEATKVDPSIHLVISETSRPARPGEEHGVDYNFRSLEAMQTRIAASEYVNVTPPLGGHLYATAPEAYSKEGIATMAVVADALPWFQSLPFAEMRTIAVLPPSYEEWRTRMAKHGLPAEQRLARLQEAQQSLRFVLNDPNVLCIVNDDINAANRDFQHAMHGRPFPNRESEQHRARAIAESIANRLTRITYD